MLALPAVPVVMSSAPFKVILPVPILTISVDETLSL
jgi:hypothetical protein